MVGAGQSLLVTRTTADAYQAVSRRSAGSCAITSWPGASRSISEARPPPRGRGTILIAAAGTADLPVAEEAAITAEVMGNTVDRALRRRGRRAAPAAEGARRASPPPASSSSSPAWKGRCPAWSRGLVDVPVVAVPTSVGYGASFGGLTALLAMLNSCATGVSVVNIDNGFGAAAIAQLYQPLGLIWNL